MTLHTQLTRLLQLTTEESLDAERAARRIERMLGADGRCGDTLAVAQRNVVAWCMRPLGHDGTHCSLGVEWRRDGVIVQMVGI